MMKYKILRQLPLFGLCVLFLILDSQIINTSAQRNIAVLQIGSLWKVFSGTMLDLPCHEIGTFPSLKRFIQPSIREGNKYAWTHLGRLLWLEGKCEYAIEAWKKGWVEKHDQNSAYELIRVGEYQSIPLELRRTIAENFYNRGIKLDMRGERQSAIVWFSRSFDVFPQRKSASKVTEFLLSEGNQSEARAIWQRMAESTTKEDAEHWWALAELYGLNQQWEGAGIAYTEGASISNEPYDFWMRAGFVWQQAQCWDEALESYQRAYQENPTSYSCIVLGNFYRIRGRYDEALKWYREAEAKSPKDAEPPFRIGETYYFMGNYDQAMKYLNEALEYDQQHFLSMYILAKIYYNNGEKENAEKWMNEALMLIPWPDARAAWWIELGDWRLEWRDCEGAKTAYSNAKNIGDVEHKIQSRFEKLISICTP